MKRKNLIKIALLLAAVMTLTACRNDTDDLYQLFNFMFLSSGTNTALPGKIDKEHEETLESIFDNINIMGATLSLPMNVSDLPEGFTLTVGKNAIETFDGNHIVIGAMTFGEDITVCRQVYILKGKNRDVSQGVIVGYEFGALLNRGSLVYDRDGHNLIYMSPSDVTELLGETEATGTIGEYYSSYYLVYTDAHGRRAGWCFEESTDVDAIVVFNFSLTAHSALDWVYLI